MKSFMYYDVSSKVKEMIEKGELKNYRSSIQSVFLIKQVFEVCVIKIHKDTNYKLEYAPGTWMMEVQKLTKPTMTEYFRKNHSTIDIYNVLENEDDSELSIESILKREDEGNTDDYEMENYKSLDELIQSMEYSRGFVK